MNARVKFQLEKAYSRLTVRFVNICKICSKSVNKDLFLLMNLNTFSFYHWLFVDSQHYLIWSSEAYLGACQTTVMELFLRKLLSPVNPCHVTALFIYPLKTSENQKFSDVFRGYRKRSMAWNGINLPGIFIFKSCYFKSWNVIFSF